MGNNLLTKYINKFKNKKILVVGDIILDKYIWGEVSRISPEAPVQVVTVEEEFFVPGGAGNTASNIVSLGAKAVLVGALGCDKEKEILLREAKHRKIDTSGIFEVKAMPTIQKVRIMAKNQQLLRIDYEKNSFESSKIEKKILGFVKSKINKMDAIIISTYAKGVITKKLARSLIKLANSESIPVIIDPKPINKSFYKNATLVTPNFTEAQEISGLLESKNIDKDVEKIGKKLVKQLNSSIVITRGEKGISFFEKKGEIKHIPTFAKEIFDVSGAGDTVVATITLALSCNLTLFDSARIANHAAGIVVRKVGTATVTPHELKLALRNEK